MDSAGRREVREGGQSPGPPFRPSTALGPSGNQLPGRCGGPWPVPLAVLPSWELGAFPGQGAWSSWFPGRQSSWLVTLQSCCYGGEQKRGAGEGGGHGGWSLSEKVALGSRKQCPTLIGWRLARTWYKKALLLVAA